MTADRFAAWSVIVVAALLAFATFVGALHASTAATADVVPEVVLDGWEIPFSPGVDDPSAICFANGGGALIYDGTGASAWCEVTT